MALIDMYRDAVSRLKEKCSPKEFNTLSRKLWHTIDRTAVSGPSKWTLVLGIGIEGDPDRSEVIIRNGDVCRGTIVKRSVAYKMEIERNI